jgi:methylase of polypeptide subunit release factors
MTIAEVSVLSWSRMNTASWRWLEPADAVFAAGDGLGPYRRLIDAARNWLAADGVLLLQLDRQVLVAGRADLPVLRASIDDSRLAVGAFTTNAA